MNIRILCVGKLKETYWSDAVAEYKKRLSAYCSLSVEEVKESPREDLAEEGEALLRRIRPEDYVILLEVTGKALDSESLAAMMGRLGLEGKSQLVFVIGGSSGLSPDVKARGDFALSFSAMTFPHQMMRVILLEQIYRGFKILRGEKYHK
jgi:23S rRNA (pseudouridine1915-N3)-methyltransferase